MTKWELEHIGLGGNGLQGRCMAPGELMMLMETLPLTGKREEYTDTALTEKERFILLVKEHCASPVEFLNAYSGQYKKTLGGFSSIVLYSRIMGETPKGYLAFGKLLALAAAVWPPESSLAMARLLEYNLDRRALREDLLAGREPAVSLTEEVLGYFWKFAGYHFAPRCKHILHTRIQAILQDEKGFEEIGKR